MFRRDLVVMLLAALTVGGVALHEGAPKVTADFFSLLPADRAENGASAPAAVPKLIAQNAAPPSPVDRQVPQSRAQVELSYAPVVKAVAPAVVNVYATTVSRQTYSPFANDPFFSQFFGGNLPMFQTRPRISRSLGSGVIVDPAGIIVTNSHVVNGATDVKVALASGQEYSVDILVDDTKSDLAVMKIKDAGGTRFPTLRFADSDKLEVGDIVLAIGNPFGVGQTVTSGIVSALGRTGIESSDYEAFIQTDAPINPGNSGGALVNLRGELVGINTAIFSKTGGSVGIGFAIPSNMVAAVARAGEQGHKLVRPWLGARLQDVTSDIANGLGMKAPRGALITEVAPDSPAERAGLKSGDVVTEVNGVEIDSPQGLNYHLAIAPMGSTAKVIFMREGKSYETSLAVEPPPSDGADPVTIRGNTRFSGVTVSNVTPALVQELGLPLNVKGVVVTDVAQGSPADALGLEEGDVLLELNDTRINDTGQFRSIASRRVRGWQITLERDGRVVRSFVSG